MNETKSERPRDAIGDASHPPDLSSRMEGRLSEPEPERPPRAIALVAALIALAIVALLLGPRLVAWRSSVPAGSLPPAASPLPVPDPGGIFALIPPEVFDAAGLSSATALVTSFQLNANNGDRKITLIGAYADPARTVLMFRTNFDLTDPLSISISDEQGDINARATSGWGGFGPTGEYFSSLDAGPRPGSDGIANLTVSVPGFYPNSPADGSQTTPSWWTFSLALKVQPSVAIAAVPKQFDLGFWKVTTEAAEITPSVIHVQAVINGARVEDTGPTTIVLRDSSGTPVDPAVDSAQAVDDRQLNPTNDKITGVNHQWLRPTSAGTYQLQFTGGGGARTINFSVGPPDPSAKLPRKGEGLAPKPGDFPVAQESLDLQGFLKTTLTSGRPYQCGQGGGPSGTIFAFGIYFQTKGAWYSFSVYSDPAVRQYTGVGTYTAIAALYGPTQQKLWAGTVQLTVTADHYPGPYNGGVQGTLDRVGTTTKEPQLTVSGTWTCSPGPMLGPG